ncbi:uncharacterized protein ACLA_067360 [Aspergillus clavatus NRRL 1]|uniref:Uncharacterized protein n=1 Tax=Aspergillus clavatus (strain ATCC 1007 / CBS 513.65 / DSM 816 / NCTC 3887 / NRRL 1 / QM 1276 / 107) TaxID=344612 RepID=A1CGL8_ASPCL|nr:uncharacterized protein ACLA_067360 [Aspergillus clavatus NRRL 1]EAW11098.1 hypothetical protein ACLA_067360 [Aspergillus clavatus NRRL 1]
MAAETFHSFALTTANAFTLGLRPQGRFDALLHTGDAPEGARYEYTSTRAGSTISRPIVRDGDPGAKNNLV